MYQVTHKIYCDEPGCKECIECEDATDKADAFNMAEADGWHITGTASSMTTNYNSLVHLWVCPECYKGSALERDNLYANHVDDQIKREKEYG